jgi:RNA polymerase sigma-70 factor, ECF subfamily
MSGVGRDDPASMYDAHAPRLWAFVRGLGLDADDAEDVVQEAFARLVSKPDVGNPKGWLFKVAYNLAMDRHRQRNQLGAFALTTSGSIDVDETARIDVWRCVDKLSVRQRSVVYLRYAADLEFADIGRILDIRSSTARATCFQAVARLREELRDDEQT